MLFIVLIVSHKNMLLTLHPDPSLSAPGTTLKPVVNNRMKASQFLYTLYYKVYFTVEITQCAMDEWSPYPDIFELSSRVVRSNHGRFHSLNQRF